MTAQAGPVSLDLVAIGALSKMDAQPVLAAKTLYMGQMVAAVTASGFMSDPAYNTTGCVLGFAEATSLAVTGESSGDRGINLFCGARWLPNFATRPVVLTDIGSVCYASDNTTVSHTSTDGPVAGVVCGVDTTLGVLVFVNPGLNYLLSQATLGSQIADASSGALGANIVGYDDSGNKTASATVADALDEIYVHLTSAHARKEIPLGEFILMATGAPLAAWATNANNGLAGVWCDSATVPKAKGIAWNPTASVCSTLVASIMPPADCDLTQPIYLKIKASKIGATLADAVTFVVGVFVQTDAALYDAGTTLGGTSGAMTGNAATKTVQLVSTTLTAWASSAVGLTLAIMPTAAKLTTDTLILHDVWIEYTRKLATS